jgi:hypothetical protein
LALQQTGLSLACGSLWRPQLNAGTLGGRGLLNMLRVALLASVVSVLSCSSANPRANWVPDKGFVPDERTAIRIAEAVWIPIYGEKVIAAERPFRAKLEDGVWLVTGSLDCPAGVLCMGGTASARISRRDGKVLKVMHTQ